MAVKGIRNETVRALVGTAQELVTSRLGGAAWNSIRGVTDVDVPAPALDAEVTVIPLTLEGALDLCRGGAIAAN